MKKLFSVLVVIALAVLAAPTANAQSTVTMPVVAGDTLSGTDTVIKTLPEITGNYAALSITGRITATTATVTGYVQVEFSDNNTNWDTLTRVSITAGTSAFKIWTFTPTAHQYHRVKFYSSAGTAICRVWYKLGKSLTAAVNRPSYSNLAVLQAAKLPDELYVKRERYRQGTA